MSIRAQNQIEDSIIYLRDKINTNNQKKIASLFFNKNNFIIYILFKIIFSFLLLIIIILNNFEKKQLSHIIKKLNNYDNNIKDKKYIEKNLSYIKINEKKDESNDKEVRILLKYEKVMPHLREINKKRTFYNRFPLPKQITCTPHFFSLEELIF